jgi:hypothetical protein
MMMAASEKQTMQWPLKENTEPLSAYRLVTILNKQQL